MSTKKIILVGFIHKGHVPSGGETMKNQLFITRLMELGLDVIPVDFYGWRKHPWTFMVLFWHIFTKSNATFIFSTSLSNSYPLMKLLYKLGIKRHFIHWVIGGSVHNKIAKGMFDVKVLNTMAWTVVQIPSMVDSLTQSGLHHVVYVPNSKPITYLPKISRNNKKIHFVFLSAVKPEKGCDYILESVKALNNEDLMDCFEVHFYGKVHSDYHNSFHSQIQGLENVKYNGVLNLRESGGYEKLANYDVMLFPTYWEGEGFAGVFIDAFIAGLPIIASDWGHNQQFLEDGKDAIIIKTHDVSSLTNAMRKCIDHQFDLDEMSKYSRSQVGKYDVNNVLTRELFAKLGII